MNYQNNEFTKTNDIKTLFEVFDINKDINEVQALASLSLGKKEIKLLQVYSQISERALKEDFKNFIYENFEKLTIEELEVIQVLINKISMSNSSEVYKHCNEFIKQLIRSQNPLENLKRIEDVFLKKNLPYVGKAFLVFDILYPEQRLMKGFFDMNFPKISPTLKSKKAKEIRSILFSDVLKASFGSNNRSIINYMNSMERGQILLEEVAADKVELNKIGHADINSLSIYVAHLNTLYNNTQAGKMSPRVLSGDLKKDIIELSKLLSSSERYDLKNRVIRIFAFGLGIKSFDDAKKYIKEKVLLADSRNRVSAKKGFELKRGDFVKGIRQIKYFSDILQNGSVAGEFLGSNASTDATPLDTDFSRIIDEVSAIYDAVMLTEAGCYGPVWLVLKNDEKFIVTRTTFEEEERQEGYDKDKLEIFNSGRNDGHYSIRGGFASSEIDFILAEFAFGKDYRVLLEIAKNGFYIPVIDIHTGKLAFSPYEYDQLRKKMTGLKYYGLKEYDFSDDLFINEVGPIINEIDSNQKSTNKKRLEIDRIVKGCLSELDLNLKEVIDGDMTSGSVEFVDIGSTGRGTNMPGTGDFDFIMRIDKRDFSDPKKLALIQETLFNAFKNCSGNSIITKEGNLRLKEVKMTGLDNPIDIDITFVEKTDKNEYSTEMSLQDRLDTIKKQDFEKYEMVVANMILAKRVLKEAGAYKANRGQDPQGGLGGVGIENWILQNGGSFKSAAIEFLKESENKIFQKFSEVYHVWDFGSNHKSFKDDLYPHDDFVFNNMSESGYLKMRHVLIEYFKNELSEEIIFSKTI